MPPVVEREERGCTCRIWEISELYVEKRLVVLQFLAQIR